MELCGMLYSQIGYDLKDPMRVIVRSTNPEYVPEGATFTVIDTGTHESVITGPMARWGEKWRSTWWIVDFSELEQPGAYLVKVMDGTRIVGETDAFTVANHRLWNETITAVALDQLEERAKRARNGNGWKDCGADWREANSHATTIIGLCDLLSIGYEWLSAGDVDRLAAQIQHGCDYLALCQDKAERIGHPKGALAHELPNHMLYFSNMP